MQGMKRLAIITATTSMLIAFAPSTHAASPAATVTGLAKYQMTASQFTVLPNDPGAVCSVTYNDEVRTKAPYTFTYDPAGSWASWADIHYCDGSSDYVDLDTEKPFDVGATVFGAREKNPGVTVRNNVDSPATATLKDPKGGVVASVDIDPNADARIAVPKATGKKTQAYSLTLTMPDGFTYSTPVAVARGWAVMDDGRPTFDPCSTVTWAYDSSRQPKGAKTFKKDIQGALKRLSAETGLNFVETKDLANADIRYHFDHINSAGLGGPDGDVTFNISDTWVTDKHAGFAPFKPYRVGNYTYTGGPDGRGWLIIHETMHVLGFDHVSDPNAVMAPMDSGKGKFTRGDLAGLHVMYRDQCAA